MNGVPTPASAADAEPILAVAAIVSASGVAARALRRVVARLAEGPQRLDDLIRDCAVPRRSVEALVQAAGSDLRDGPDGRVALRDEVAARYRETFGYQQLRRTEPDDPFAAQLSAQAALVARLHDLIAAAPTGNQALDHVAATAATVVRRALWLDATFDLDGAHLVCIGDHDLTGLAVRSVNPGCRVSVVDVDERLLEYVGTSAAALGLPVDRWYADLRFGLPPRLVEAADLIVTDPPYTPDGVQLFLGRGAQALRDRVNGRLVMAYGFSPLAPALGLKVQHAVHELDLAIEAILPGFNRYHGAQAVGSASDLYVCRPTSRTARIAERKLARTGLNIYTHGGQSVEGQAAAEIAGWAAGTQRLTTAEVFADGPVAAGRQAASIAVDLADDPGPWLLRALLSVNAERLELLVPNRHPDLADAAGQSALRELVAAKYHLRFRRSTPTNRHAVVEATAVDEPAWLLTHVHGKLGNVLREALVRASAGRGDSSLLTKNAARALVAAAVPDPAWLDSRLLDLPRGAIQTIIAAYSTMDRTIHNGQLAP